MHEKNTRIAQSRNILTIPYSYLLCSLILLSSCSDDGEVREHYAPKDYEGWLTAVYYYDEDNAGHPVLHEIVFDKDGFASFDGRLSNEWRSDYFFQWDPTIGKKSRKAVDGEFGRSGSRYISDTEETFHFVSGWIGSEPAGGREDHIEMAIAAAAVSRNDTEKQK